jgi:CRISPR-associated protein Cpf1
MSKFKEFIGLYPLSKTLRFELIPKGKTLGNFKTSGILERDEHRADSYKKMKDIIDNYHRFIIDKSLKGFKLEIEKNDKYDSLEDVIGKKNDAWS